jgi:hypothetical protein
MTANTVRVAQTLPNSQVGIASYSSYIEAQEAANHLSSHGFSPDRIRIVARPSHAAENSKTNLNPNWIAFQGASEGAMVGLVLSIMIGLVNIAQPLTATLFMAIPGILGGAMVGLALRLLGHNFSGAQGDLSSLRLFENQHIVMVDKHLSREASRLLEGPY